MIRRYSSALRLRRLPAPPGMVATSLGLGAAQGAGF